MSTVLSASSGIAAASAIKAINSSFQSPSVEVIGQNVGFASVASSFDVSSLWAERKPAFFHYILAGEIESIAANMLSYLDCSQLFSTSFGVPGGPYRKQAFGGQDASFATAIDDLGKVIDGTYAEPFYKACLAYGKSEGNPLSSRQEALRSFGDYAGEQRILADMLYLGLVYDSTVHDQDDFMAYVTNLEGSDMRNAIGGMPALFSYERPRDC